jgi:hypothetical protein
LIPVTIALSCIPLLRPKTFPVANWFPSAITLIFGLIHGLGFGRYFSLIVSEDEALVDLLSFALGVEAVQIVIVVGILIVNLLFLNVLKINKSRWQLVIGAMILSQAIRMIIETIPFNLFFLI